MSRDQRIRQQLLSLFLGRRLLFFRQLLLVSWVVAEAQEPASKADHLGAHMNRQFVWVLGERLMIRLQEPLLFGQALTDEIVVHDGLGASCTIIIRHGRRVRLERFFSCVGCLEGGVVGLFFLLLHFLFLLFGVSHSRTRRNANLLHVRLLAAQYIGRIQPVLEATSQTHGRLSRATQVPQDHLICTVTFLVHVAVEFASQRLVLNRRHYGRSGHGHLT